MTCRDSEIEANANKLHTVVKNFERFFPEEFEKTDINRCGHCDSTGLKDRSMSKCPYFCFNCGGTGYVGYEKIYKSYTCRMCNGSGCDICDYTGMVDWVTHANGRDVRSTR